MSWWTGLQKKLLWKMDQLCYDKIPKEVIVTREKDHGLQMWEQQWMDTRKGAVTKVFFPSVRKRMITQKIPIFPELTTMLTGRGNIKSYLYRLGLTDNWMCPCEEEEQNVDHLIFKCKKLRKQRNKSIIQIKKHWWQLACN